MNLSKLADDIHEHIARVVTPALKAIELRFAAIDARIAAIPKGDTGPAGEKGEQGIPGPQGPPGAIGERGEKGDQGIQGLVGERGLDGAMGVKGDKGDVGPVGERGEKGYQGEKGLPGEQGPPGQKGEQGLIGERGEKGDKGEAADVVYLITKLAEMERRIDALIVFSVQPTATPPVQPDEQIVDNINEIVLESQFRKALSGFKKERTTTIVNVQSPEVIVHNTTPAIKIPAAQVNVAAPEVNIENHIQPPNVTVRTTQPVVHVAAPEVVIKPPPINVDVKAPDVTVEAAKAPDVHVTVEAAKAPDVHVVNTISEVETELEHVRDDKGRISKTVKRQKVK